jgi:U3 small nucleolar RNA-associated protein 10
MLKSPDLMRFTASLLPEAIKDGYSHRTLINFHTATLVEYISRAESLDSGNAVVFLSNFLEPLESKGSVPKDAIVSRVARLQ